MKDRTPTPGTLACRGHEGGFVLPVALFVLVVLSMISATGLYVARSDFRAAQATRQAAVALAAADAGASRTVATWSLAVPSLPAPGDSLVVDWQTLPDGSLYRSVVVRAPVGGGETAAPRVLVHTTGRVAPPGDARRTVVTLVEITGGPGLCCSSAFKVSARVRVTGPRTDDGLPDIDGTDLRPPGWPAADCTTPPQDLPGVLTSDASGVETRRTGDVAGSPPVLEDTAITPADFTTFGSVTYADLAALANSSFTGNQRFTNQVGPVVSGGLCVTGDPLNWGSPGTPNGPCGDYFPIIHVAGNLRLQGSGEGQGVLLVDGDLQIDDDFQFYGVVVVLGVLNLNGPGNIFGALLVRGNANGQGRSDIDGGGRVVYSSCATQKAMQGLPPAASGGGASAQQRSWFEVIG
jgi:type II secretory pathway pseudopilin PulG